MTKNICVFCSSSEDITEIYHNAAKTLGEQLAKNGYDIIHGAGSIGLMGTLMRSAAQFNCRITGVVPERLNKPNIVSGIHQELIITADMKERKEYMRENSDAFIALPGGFGTLEELLEVITLKQLKYHNKPIVIINTLGFFDKLLEHFENMYQQNFSNSSYKRLYYIALNPEDAIYYIKNYKAENIYDKYLGE
ncbi:MAG: TIGR00730 family Rossman fold protein [Bacteroidales bacterium]|jgi:uncharacterized protein (TIGR00730 family)|nr:TIGR00730 family Rossman fold protein [Bacteroidales bacterium]